MTIQKTKILTVLCVFFVVFSCFCSVKADDLIYYTGFEQGDDDSYVETTYSGSSSILVTNLYSPFEGSYHLDCYVYSSVGAKAFVYKQISPLAEVYAQLMINWDSGFPTNQKGIVVFGAGNVSDGGQCNVVIFNDNGNYCWGVRYDSGGWNTVFNASSSVSQEVYYKVELRVSQTSYSLWINDVLTLTESGLNIDSSYSYVFCGNTYNWYAGAHKFFLDNLKISDDYIGAIPEPTEEPTAEPTEEPTAEPTATVTSSPRPTSTVPFTLSGEQYLFLFNFFPFIIICIPALILGYYYKTMGLLVGFLIGSIVGFGIGLIPSWVFILILVGIATGVFMFKKYET